MTKHSSPNPTYGVPRHAKCKRWRYSDARVNEIEFVEVGHPDDPLGPGLEPNRTFDVEPHAEGADYDDSGWRKLA